MTTQQSMPATAFNKEHADVYDTKWKPLSPLTDALHLLSRSALNALPDDAHILCAGVGTGADIMAFAPYFPGWRFTGFDPSGAMLDVCRARIKEAGLAARCTLYQGYVDDLPHTDPFDGAVCFLVSHFLIDPVARGAFFGAVAERLASGALFLNADLASDFGDDAFEDLMHIWLATIAGAGLDEEAQQNYRHVFGKTVAAHEPHVVERLIETSGFSKPVQYYQAGMIRAWYCRKQ